MGEFAELAGWTINLIALLLLILILVIILMVKSK